MAADLLAADLKRAYDLTAVAIQPHPGGFESDCWIVDRKWIVKVWKKGRVPQRLELLDRLRDAGLPVVGPARTTDGRVSSSSGGRPYAVFPYIRGRTASLRDWVNIVDVMKRVHAVTGIDLPTTTFDEPWIGELRDSVDHPWIADRADQVRWFADRLEAVIDKARATDVPHVLCHGDLQGGNLLIDGEEVVAILDWDWARSAPREHDLWIAADTRQVTEFLDRYGAHDLNPVHFEYSRLARALRDLYARIVAEIDRAGVETWGFKRLAGLERDLRVFRPYCRPS